jgi:hypothetical protein
MSNANGGGDGGSESNVAVWTVERMSTGRLLYRLDDEEGRLASVFAEDRGGYNILLRPGTGGGGFRFFSGSHVAAMAHAEECLGYPACKKNFGKKSKRAKKDGIEPSVADVLARDGLTAEPPMTAGDVIKNS